MFGLFKRRKTLSDLDKNERRRVKALMLGAGAPAKPDDDGVIRVHHEDDEVKDGERTED